MTDIVIHVNVPEKYRDNVSKTIMAEYAKRFLASAFDTSVQSDLIKEYQSALSRTHGRDLQELIDSGNIAFQKYYAHYKAYTAEINRLNKLPVDQQDKITESLNKIKSKATDLTQIKYVIQDIKNDIKNYMSVNAMTAFDLNRVETFMAEFNDIMTN